MSKGNRIIIFINLIYRKLYITIVQYMLKNFPLFAKRVVNRIHVVSNFMLMLNLTTRRNSKVSLCQETLPMFNIKSIVNFKEKIIINPKKETRKTNTITTRLYFRFIILFQQKTKAVGTQSFEKN